MPVMQEKSECYKRNEDIDKSWDFDHLAEQIYSRLEHILNGKGSW